jgi:hypothetical protein
MQVLGDDVLLVNEQFNETWDKSHSDLRTQDAIDAWSSCMEEAGYAEADDPLTFNDQFTAARRMIPRKQN